MFTTLRFGNDALVAAQAGSLACNTCRSRKLKCTRENGGCHRCLSRDIECVYPDTTQKRSKKRKAAHRSRVKLGTVGSIKPPPTSHNEVSINQSGTLSSDPRMLSWGLNPFSSTPDYVESLFDIERPEDLNSSDDMRLARYSQHGLDHTFEESLNDSHPNNADVLGLFPTENRPLDDSDFFLRPWSQESPSSSGEARRPMPGLTFDETPPPTSTPDATCQCTNQVLQLLEAVIHHDTLSTLSSVPTDLSLNKRTLTKGKKFLDCQRCSSSSSFITLLVLLCQQTTTSYENIIAKLCDQFNKIHSDDPFTPQRNDNSSLAELHVRGTSQIQGSSDGENGLRSEPATDTRLLFKNYEVDVEEEPCVFGGLTSMQLKTLVLFLGRLRRVSRGRGWVTHGLMVDAVEKKVFALLRVTNSCGGRVESD